MRSLKSPGIFLASNRVLEVTIFFEFLKFFLTFLQCDASLASLICGQKICSSFSDVIHLKPLYCCGGDGNKFTLTFRGRTFLQICGCDNKFVFGSSRLTKFCKTMQRLTHECYGTILFTSKIVFIRKC